MKKFEKLSKSEMKNVKGGQFSPPNCTVGSACYDVRGSRGACAANEWVGQPCKCIVGGLWSGSYCQSGNI